MNSSGVQAAMSRSNGEHEHGVDPGRLEQLQRAVSMAVSVGGACSGRGPPSGAGRR